MTHATDTAAAWAFVLEHQDRLPKLCHRYYGALSEDDRTEFINDVILRLVEKFPAYDHSRSAPVTWIVWQIRAVSTSWTRRFNKRVREGVGRTIERGSDRVSPLTLLAVPDDRHGSHHHATTAERQEDARVQVAAIYSDATPKQKLAMQSILAGVDAGVLADKYGMTVRDRNRHIRALRARLED